MTEAVALFGMRVAAKLGRGGQNEEQLRGPTEQLFQDLGNCLGYTVIPYGEVDVPEFGVRPDFAIDLECDRIGYIELKAPGTGVPPEWKKDSDRNNKQYGRMRDLPNLVYSDGVTWRLFRSGRPPGPIVKLDGDLTEGNLKPGNDGSFHDLINTFLGWAPTPPKSLNKLIKVIAGPCRMLRAGVTEILAVEAERPNDRRIFTQLAEDWRKLLFPQLADKDFPDAYAQTVTFALLLAREGGVSFEGRDLHDIAEQLKKQHALMGRALHVLTHEEAVRQLKILDTLRIIIGTVDWQALPARDREKYWDLYEPFLTEYDKHLRQESGSYYTPEPVAGFMVDFVDRILWNRLDCESGFATDHVVAMDPAMGTGTFLVEVIRVAAKTSTEEHNEKFARGVLRDLYRRRLIGFERSAAPYVVAELRLQQTLKDVYKTEPPDQSMRFLTNTLDDPSEPRQQGLEYAEITESRDRADRIKRKTPIVAIVGNPPYLTRAHQRDPAFWVEKPRTEDDPADHSDRPALADFREPGNGSMEYPLSNTGTYFWRWSTWKVFDAHPDHRVGVVALITTSTYLKGAAFKGMRRYLRKTCDEGWIIDLSPEGQRPAVSTRVFRGVKEPICIGIFIRTRDARGLWDPAVIRYRALEGTRRDKFAELAGGFPLAGPGWRTCPAGWTDDFLPEDRGWVSHPLITDMAQWGVSGIKPGLTWVYAPRPEVLEQRWARFAAAKDKEVLFKDQGLSGRRMPRSLQHAHEMPVIEECAFRAFDRQYIFADPRLADRLRTSLWGIRGSRQVYASIQHDQAIKAGPAVIFTDQVPDQHHFAARGGKVLPLYKHAQGQGWASNIPLNFRQYLATELRVEIPITPEDVFAYIAAVAAHPGYTQWFWDSLRRPGIRIPLTAERDLWLSAVNIGAEVIWLHTFGTRYQDPAQGRPEKPRLPRDRQPAIINEILDEPDTMPDDICYDSVTGQLHIGTGIIAPVAAKAWEYQVSGRPVIRQWFSFRCRNRQYQRRTSPLDDIRVGRWTYHLDRDLLNLINVLTRLTDLESRQEALVQEICNGRLVTVGDLESADILPPPTAARNAPRPPQQDELRYDTKPS